MSYKINLLNRTKKSDTLTIDLDFEKMVCVRSYGAGVFVGELESSDDAKRCVTLKNCRRIWYWDGAATLSQLSEEGVKKADTCKFPQIVKKIKIFDVIEIIQMSEEAIESIYAVKEWRVDYA